ncbi:hypothetical protein LOAG_08639 [Loa loa]|uniref:Uncharacterized protein n=1 Tax=Loa loa TaxID=7209 RepID=A0A1S0TTV3_LOALO|nr:hypothetical protein LOAG_08639 [Loa loa]EFO19852.1 hypothetical protein LOAG_08639 [Loa loa]
MTLRRKYTIRLIKHDSDVPTCECQFVKITLETGYAFVLLSLFDFIRRSLSIAVSQPVKMEMSFGYLKANESILPVNVLCMALHLRPVWHGRPYRKHFPPPAWLAT